MSAIEGIAIIADRHRIDAPDPKLIFNCGSLGFNFPGVTAVRNYRGNFVPAEGQTLATHRTVFGRDDRFRDTTCCDDYSELINSIAHWR